MASRANTGSLRPSSLLVVKEGFLNKKGGIIKNWNRRYFMLNKQSLVYFRREQELDKDSGLSPLGRIFLSDVINIETENVEKKKPFVFAVHTKKRILLFQAFSAEDLESWVNAIRNTLKKEGEAEKKDPFRRTLRRLAPGLKRVTLMKDPKKGIGCTVKSAAGHIFVNRIIEDGPIALTGVLRPEDEILDVNGVVITGMTVIEVGAVIHACPEEFLATVRPITALKKLHPQNTTRINYVTMLPNITPSNLNVGGDSGISKDMSSDGSSLDDVGNYSDDGTPPPIPVWTDDALVMTQPPIKEVEGQGRRRSQSLGSVSDEHKSNRKSHKVPTMNYIDVEIVTSPHKKTQ